MSRPNPARLAIILFAGLALARCPADEVVAATRLRQPGLDARGADDGRRTLEAVRQASRGGLLALARRPWTAPGAFADPKVQAIILLGESRDDAEEVIKALIDQWTFGMTAGHLAAAPEGDHYALYPAAAALVRIGRPAVLPVLLHFRQAGRDDFDHALGVRILVEILGAAGARSAIGEHFIEVHDRQLQEKGRRLLAVLEAGPADGWTAIIDPGRHPRADAVAALAAARAALDTVLEDGSLDEWFDGGTPQGLMVGLFFRELLPALVNGKEYAKIRDWLTRNEQDWKDGPAAPLCRRWIAVAGQQLEEGGP